MPLVFSNPALLFGALTAALPVIIHFLSRRRVQRRTFSDLRFLDEVQARQARSLGLRRWLLLLLRVLALLLIALAVAGPRWGGLLSSGSGNRSVLFVIDNSASMNTQLGQGTRLDEALTASAAMIQSLPDNSSVQIITSGSQTEAVFGDWLPAASGAVSGLNQIIASDGMVDHAAVMREAAQQITDAPTAQVEMVWVGDLQEFSTNPANLQAAQNLPENNLVHHLVRQVGQTESGGGILSINLPQRSLHEGENITLSAQVTTQFPEEVVALELSGRTVAETVVAEPSSTPVTVEFTLAVPEPGLHSGRIRRQSDTFAADDVRPFVLEVPHRLPVLLVHGPDRAVDDTAGRGGWRYLAEALSPGQEPGLFRVESISSAEMTTGDLDRYQVVVLCNPEPLGRRATESLVTWANQGGSIMMLLGDAAQASYYAGSLLPVLMPELEPALRQAGSLAYLGGNANQPQRQRAEIISPQHPVFTGLEPEALATLEDVIWRRWFKLAENAQAPSEGPTVLLAMADDSPLLMESTLGTGRVALLPFDLNKASNGLATSAMALPLFQRLAAWLAGGNAEQAGRNQFVGEVAAVVPWSGSPTSLLERREDLLVFEGPASADATAHAANLIWQNGSPLLVSGVTDRAGFSIFTAAGDTVGMVAAAIHPAESNLTLMTPEQWRSRLESWGLQLSLDLGSSRQDDLGAAMAGQALAPWFFLAALLLLLLELFVGRRASP